MSNRSKRRNIAKETVEILDRGSYQCENKNTVLIGDSLERSIDQTKHYSPEDFAEVLDQRDELLKQNASNGETRFVVENSTTLSSARSLLGQDASQRVLCLNFASAKNPGGGFLGGSQAQEESLARASGLYASINRVRGYYDSNRACGTCLYTDHMIYSPDVPVFRDDKDMLLSAPYEVSFITAPAVNLGALANQQSDQVALTEETMKRRIERVLSLAVIHQHRAIILGAWGCGVFKNNPDDVAKWFQHFLKETETFRGAFDHVIFGVLDSTPDLKILKPFQDHFSQN